MPTLDDLMAVVPRPTAEVRIRPHPDPAHDDSVDIQRALDTRAKRIILDPEVSHGVRANFKCKKPLLVTNPNGVHIEGDGFYQSVLNFSDPSVYGTVPGPGVAVYNPWWLQAIPAYGQMAHATADGMVVGQTAVRRLDMAGNWVVANGRPVNGPRMGVTYKHGAGTTAVIGSQGYDLRSSRLQSFSTTYGYAHKWTLAHSGERWQLSTHVVGVWVQLPPSSLVVGQTYTISWEITATAATLTVNGVSATVEYADTPFPWSDGLDEVNIGGSPSYDWHGWVRDVWIDTNRYGPPYVRITHPLTVNEWHGPCAKAYATGPGITGTQFAGYTPLAGGNEDYRGSGIDVKGMTLEGFAVSGATHGLCLFSVKESVIDSLRLDARVDGIRADQYSYAMTYRDNLVQGGVRYGFWGGINSGYGHYTGGTIFNPICAVRVTGDFASVFRDLWVYNSTYPFVASASRATLSHWWVFNEAGSQTAPVVSAVDGSYVTIDGGTQLWKPVGGDVALADGANSTIRSYGTDYAYYTAPTANDVVFRTLNGGKVKSFGDSRAGTYNGSLVPWTNDPDSLTQVGAIN